jgi:single-strand DNA-binding protein
MGLNILTATGNLGRDADQRFTSSSSIVTFSIPLEAGFGNQKTTTWINCNVWGKQGEALLPYLKKGQQVGVSGEFSIREWVDKEGNKRQSPELRVEKMKLLGSRPSETSASAVPQTGSDGQEPGGSAMNGDFDDDIPF